MRWKSEALNPFLGLRLVSSRKFWLRARVGHRCSQQVQGINGRAEGSSTAETGIIT